MRSRTPINLWSPYGRISREGYVALGIVLAGLKFAMDAAIAQGLFGRSWTPVQYFAPSEFSGLLTFSADDRVFFGTLLLFSLPFAWVGVALTLRRLRAAGLPTWMSVGFFVPLINIVLFIALSVMPSQPLDDEEAPPMTMSPRAWIGSVIPNGQWSAAVLAVFLTAALGVGATTLGTHVLEFYGWGVFTALPFCLGLFSAILFGYHEPRNYGACIGVATSGIAVTAGLMILFAIEGIICLIMAIPLWVPCTWLGATIGYVIQSTSHRVCAKTPLMLAMAVAIPTVVAVESAANPKPSRHSVSTATTIAAAPQIVWHHVIAFPALPEPTDWIFKTGIAYPTHATIEGHGVQAVRYCTFSTGSFVEPIEIWDEPRLLRFSVTDNPPTMQEWSIRTTVNPPHLTGFLTSEQGQFLLTPLPDGGTRLEGTTWYRNRMWPEAYWRLWSDLIIHRIHDRVLDHIRLLAESEQNRDRAVPAAATATLPAAKRNVQAPPEPAATEADPAVSHASRTSPRRLPPSEAPPSVHRRSSDPRPSRAP